MRDVQLPPKMKESSMFKKLASKFLSAIVGLLSLAVLSGNASAADPRPMGIDVDAPVLNDFTVQLGQTVYFKRQHSEGVAKSVAFSGNAIEALDRKKWPMIISGSVLNAFKAVKVGTAEIEITSQVVAPGATPHSVKLTVTVQPKQVIASTVEDGTRSRMKKSDLTTATTSAQWQTLWTAHSTNTIPNVDFTKKMVVAAFMGQQPSSGYSIEIVKVEDDGKNLIVSYRETESAKGGATQLTSPYHIVTVPANKQPVLFKKVK
jgi:hypothetical protein